MVLHGLYGETFEITLLGYVESPGVANRHDLNWLNVTVSACTPTGTWATLDLSMLTWELQQLHEWLRAHAAEDKYAEPMLELVEPQLGFEIVRGHPEMLLRVTTRFGLGSEPPPADTSEEARTVNLVVSHQALANAADTLRAEAARYPER
jgi:hypothetical protein